MLSDASDAEKPSSALFPDLNFDERDGVTELESLCLNCHEQVSNTHFL